MNKCSSCNNNSFISCRVSFPSVKASTNHSDKCSITTTTRNRFDALNKVSHESLSIDADGGVSRSLHRKDPTQTKSKPRNKSTRDQNPTGDIWDQASLNLDTLFRAKTNDAYLRIGIWNAESVRAKENLAKQYILDNDLDIFIILESWLEKDELPSTVDILPCLTEYKLHQLPRPDRKNASGGGMLCIYKHNIDIKHLSSIKTKILETMDLKLIANNRAIRIVSVYRPPRTEKRKYPIADFYNDMEKLVSHYSTVKDEVILCGDYNVHMNKPEMSETRRFNTIIETANLRQHVTETTHLKGNMLDLVMSDRNSTLINKCMVDAFMSDHAAVLIDLNLKKPPRSRRSIKFRKLREVDINELECDIDKNLHGIKEITDLTELVDKFNQALSDALDKHAPLISKNIIIRPPTPWTYDDIKKDKATRRYLERKWRCTGLQVDKDSYREFQNKYNTKLNDFRNKQYAEIIENNKNDPTTLFRVINKSLHRKQASPLPTGFTKGELAEKFSNFFSDKIDNIRKKIDDQQSMNTDNVVSESNDDIPEFSSNYLLKKR